MRGRRAVARTSCRPTARSTPCATRRRPSVGPADRRERDVEEARRAHRPHPARREGGLGGVHEDARGRRGARAGVPARWRAGWGRAADVAVTDMSQPLGDAVGNALDSSRRSSSCAGTFRGRLRDLSVLFAAKALEAPEGIDHDEALARAERALDDGAALERFRRMVEAQGGDPRVVDDPDGGPPRRRSSVPLEADRTGRSPPWTRRRSAGERGVRCRPAPQGRSDRPRRRYRGALRRSATGWRPASPSGRCTRGRPTPPPRRRGVSWPRSRSTDGDAVAAWSSSSLDRRPPS